MFSADALLIGLYVVLFLLAGGIFYILFITYKALNSITLEELTADDLDKAIGHYIQTLRDENPKNK